MASDGPGEYPVIAEARAGNDGLGVTVTPGTVAYVTTGGDDPFTVIFILFYFLSYSALCFQAVNFKVILAIWGLYGTDSTLLTFIVILSTLLNCNCCHDLNWI